MLVDSHTHKTLISSETKGMEYVNKVLLYIWSELIKIQPLVTKDNIVIIPSDEDENKNNL